MLASARRAPQRWARHSRGAGHCAPSCKRALAPLAAASPPFHQDPAAPFRLFVQEPACCVGFTRGIGLSISLQLVKCVRPSIVQAQQLVTLRRHPSHSIHMRGFGDAGASALADALAASHSLRQLLYVANTLIAAHVSLLPTRVSDCGIQAAGAAALGSALRYHRHLESFKCAGVRTMQPLAIRPACTLILTRAPPCSLSNNPISDVGASAISSALQSNCVLRKLECVPFACSPALA